MRLICYLLISLFATTLADQPDWEPCAPLKFGVFRATASVSKSKIVVVGGAGSTGAALNVIQVYDVETNQWTISQRRLANGLFEHGQTTLADGRVLITGGKTGFITDRKTIEKSAEAYLYNAGTDTLEQIDPMPQAPGYVTAHTLPDGRAIVIGGKYALIYNPADRAWLKPIKLKYHRRDHASAVLTDGRVMVAAGSGRKSVEVINPADGTVNMPAARLPFQLDDLKMTALADGGAWILGGQQTLNGDTTERTWLIYPDDRPMAEGPALGIKRGVSDHCVATIKHLTIVAGGESERGRQDEELATARILDTRSKQIWKLPDLPLAHDDAAAVSIGKSVYILGGYRLESAFGGIVHLPSAAAEVWRLTLPDEKLR